VLFAMETIQSSSHAFELSGSESSLATYQISKSRVEEAQAALENLTGDNPKQQRLLSALKRIDAQNIQWADTGIALRRSASMAPVTEFTDKAGEYLAADEVQGVVSEVRKEELRLLVLRDADVDRRLVQTKIILI